MAYSLKQAGEDCEALWAAFVEAGVDVNCRGQGDGVSIYIYIYIFYGCSLIICIRRYSMKHV